MTERTFELRLSSTHEAPDNGLKALQVEVLTEGGWEALDLNLNTRGFLIFVYSVFICQHMYLHSNATELGLALDTVHGKFRLTTSEDWFVREIDASFDVGLRSGRATGDQVAFIIDRMKNCPVSRNLKETAKHTQLQFV
jgi:hypothetical protein